MFEAVIFDLDGTLVDSLADIATAMDHALAAHGLPTHELDAYRNFVGSGVAVLAEQATPLREHGQLESLQAAFREYYLEHLVVRTMPYEGIEALLQELAAEGVPLAVLSNKPHGPAQKIVAKLFAGVRFDAVFGQRPDVANKPDPTVALELAVTMGVAADRCAFVGDTPVDMETARRAAMIGVGALWGFRSREELEQAGAQHLFERPAELMTLR